MITDEELEFYSTFNVPLNEVNPKLLHILDELKKARAIIRTKIAPQARETLADEDAPEDYREWAIGILEAVGETNQQP